MSLLTPGAAPAPPGSAGSVRGDFLYHQRFAQELALLAQRAGDDPN
ncbi:MAG: hypothetical protein U0X75_20140 [Acidobacteriota bacterium]